MRTVLLLLFALVTGSVSTAGETRQGLWPCYWTHGRLTAGEGTPATRIWPSGTHHILGVVNARHPIADDAYAPTIPDSALDLLTPENGFTAWGDFYVCPVAPERAGWMRFVVVKKTRNLSRHRT